MLIKPYIYKEQSKSKSLHTCMKLQTHLMKNIYSHLPPLQSPCINPPHPLSLNNTNNQLFRTHSESHPSYEYPLLIRTFLSFPSSSVDLSYAVIPSHPSSLSRFRSSYHSPPTSLLNSDKIKTTPTTTPILNQDTKPSQPRKEAVIKTPSVKVLKTPKPQHEIS